MATRFVSFDAKLHAERRTPNIILISRIGGAFYMPSGPEKVAMGLHGVMDFSNVRSFTTARVHGVHFKGGEWGQRTCGSVFTTVYCGRSRYGIIEQFLRVEEQEFVVVTWLSKPVYPYAPITLVVRVHMVPVTNTSQPVHRCVIPCDRIVPTPVSVMPCDDGVNFFVMRHKGVDKRLLD